MNGISLLPVDRFLHSLSIVAQEASHLAYSWNRLYSQSIDTDWVSGLVSAPDRAEQMEAFIARFGRMQDTIAGKLLPRLLLASADEPGSQIETLNKAERLGVLDDVEVWLEIRQLRNRLVHEYAEDDAGFAADLMAAKQYARALINTYNNVREYALNRLEIDEGRIPRSLELTDL